MQSFSTVDDVHRRRYLALCQSSSRMGRSAYSLQWYILQWRQRVLGAITITIAKLHGGHRVAYKGYTLRVSVRQSEKLLRLGFIRKADTWRERERDREREREGSA
jgi:hypothetical protein